MASAPIPPGVTAAIASRDIHPEESTLAATAARAILRRGFGDPDRQRLHDLAAKDQAGALTPEERAALDGYLNVGLLDLLRATAHLALMRAAPRR
jgi:hypothetical protein